MQVTCPLKRLSNALATPLRQPSARPSSNGLVFHQASIRPGGRPMVRWKERAIEQASREEWFFVSEVQPTDDPSLKGLWGLPAARPSLLDPGAGGFAHGKAQEVREDF